MPHTDLHVRCARYAGRCARYVGLVLVCVLIGCASARAAQLDLRLVVDYAGASPSAGGTWNLFARSDEQGIFALGVSIDQVDAAMQFELPSGTVNGTDPAGFANLINDPTSGGRRLFATQQILPQSASEQGLFYGVGTQSGASPGTIGPTIASLSAPQNIPWATNDLVWPTGVHVASGTFAAGLTPDFATALDSPQALLFTSLGSSGMAGAIASATSFTTLLQTNLSLGTDMGDYNADGSVDAADYTVWRDTLNQSVSVGTGADGSGNGLIDAPDYAVWRQNYGATASSGAQSVPEPSAGLGLLLTVIVGGLRGVRRGAGVC